MLQLNPENAIAFFNNQSVFFTWAVMLLGGFTAILLLLRLFGKPGLYVYMGVANIAASIQVLKIIEIPGFSHPVALGSVLFNTIFLSKDILTEYYGAAAGRRGVWFGFVSFALFTFMMQATLGFTPILGQSTGHDHMKQLFTPAPALLVASMSAYLLSQFYGVSIFSFIKRLTKGRFLWLRNNVATMLSSLIDNIVFSTLAWYVLAPNPLSWEVIIFTYILGTYVIRVVVAILNTPIIYLAKYCRPTMEEDTKHG